MAPEKWASPLVSVSPAEALLRGDILDALRRLVRDADERDYPLQDVPALARRRPRWVPRREGVVRFTAWSTEDWPLTYEHAVPASVPEPR